MSGCSLFFSRANTCICCAGHVKVKPRGPMRSQKGAGLTDKPTNQPTQIKPVLFAFKIGFIFSLTLDTRLLINVIRASFYFHFCFLFPQDKISEKRFSSSQFESLAAQPVITSSKNNWDSSVCALLSSLSVCVPLRPVSWSLINHSLKSLSFSSLTPRQVWRVQASSDVTYGLLPPSGRGQHCTTLAHTKRHPDARCEACGSFRFFRFETHSLEGSCCATLVTHVGSHSTTLICLCLQGCCGPVTQAPYAVAPLHQWKGTSVTHVQAQAKFLVCCSHLGPSPVLPPLTATALRDYFWAEIISSLKLCF